MLNVKLAFRTLWKTPFVTLVAILSLGLGIGANGAIFSLFDQMLLRSLPAYEPSELVNVKAPGPKQGSTSCNQSGDCDEILSYPMFLDLEKACLEGEKRTLTGLAAHRTFGANLAYKGQTASSEGSLVSGSYFPVLGLQPALGRLLDPGDDDVVGESRVVVLSHGFWRSRFGAAENVLNDTLVVNGHSLTIVGVAPQGFNGTTLGSRPKVFVPITLRGLMSPNFDGFENRQSYWAYTFGRLAPGATLEEAQTALNVPYNAILHDVEAPLQDAMSEETLAQFKAKEILLEPGHRGQSQIHKHAKVPLILLFTVAAVVLLIACANVANLMLARSAARGSEMAVRLSIGADRRKLIAQLLTESCLLAALGGIAGLLFAHWTLVLIGRLMPPEATESVALTLNLDVIGFASVLALLTGILFGLFPALHSSRIDLATVIKGQSGQPSGSRSAAFFRNFLVTGQIALATALLISAGLFTKSLLNVSKVDLGLQVDNMLTFGVSPELNNYTPEQSRAFFQRAEEEIAAVPGVSSVTVSLVPLLAGSNWGNNVTVEGFKADLDTDTNSRFNEIGPGYFRTMRIPLISGREFTLADKLEAPNVAIVNETFAEKFGLGRQAVGKRMAQGRTEDLNIEIVGLVQDAKYSEVKGEIPPLFFRPYLQDENVGFINFYVRTELPPEEMLPTVAGVIKRLDPNLPVDELKTMPQQVRENIAVDRVLTTLSATFAALATLLAAIGLYGVLAYTVAQRTREIGLRMALGADAWKVRTMVLVQMGKMALIGGVVGIAAAIGIGTAARSQLFEIAGHDPVVLVVSCAVLTIVALGSGFLPALRASRVDPMNALRYE